MAQVPMTTRQSHDREGATETYLARESEPRQRLIDRTVRGMFVDEVEDNTTEISIVQEGTILRKWG
jgi:hypothetical protein